MSRKRCGRRGKKRRGFVFWCLELFYFAPTLIIKFSKIYSNKLFPKPPKEFETTKGPERIGKTTYIGVAHFLTLNLLLLHYIESDKNIQKTEKYIEKQKQEGSMIHWEEADIRGNLTKVVVLHSKSASKTDIMLELHNPSDDSHQ